MMRPLIREDEISQFDQTELDKREFETKLIKRWKKKKFPIPMEPIFRTFNTKSKQKLSPHVKRILLTWSRKPFYDANEDILYLLKFNLVEQDFLLRTLHSMAILIQNETCTCFTQIFIEDVTIMSNNASQDYSDSDFEEGITFKVRYYLPILSEKTEDLW